jgi:S-adenosylmethionine decarboxylase
MPALGVHILVGEDGMRQAALLRSDKGLGTPGTDRKKARPAVTPVEAAAPAVTPVIDDRKDHFVVRNGVRCAGVHLIVDLYEAKHLDNIDLIDEALRKCVAAAGATLLHIHLHHFEPNGGVSGVAVLAESHISIHTWPEASYAAIDIFMCGRANPDACIPVLREAFKPKNIAVGEHLRGQGS